jgi:hypothetical protein
MAVARFLTASDAARVLGITPGAVRLMLKRGALPVAERTVGGINLYLRDDVYRLAEERRERQSQGARALAGRASGGR